MTKNARMHTAALLLLLLLVALCAAEGSAQDRGERFDFYTRGPYREQVPRPQSLLRYDVGAFHTNYAMMERVVQAIAQAAPDLPPIASPSARPGRVPEAVPGAIMRAALDRRTPLTYGYEQATLPVLVDSAYFFRPSKEGTNAVVFAAEPSEPLHVAGFIWPTTESLLRGTTYVIDEPTGRGHVVLFAEDPNFRAIWRSTTRLFFNSFLFQPIL
jgi:hypothetical protein